jgi:hypothetical protein
VRVYINKSNLEAKVEAERLRRDGQCQTDRVVVFRYTSAWFARTREATVGAITDIASFGLALTFFSRFTSRIRRIVVWVAEVRGHGSVC